MRWLLVAALGLVLGCGGGSGSDTIVGVAYKCRVAGNDRTGPDCLDATKRPGNVRQEMTVRTPKGTTYTVEVPAGVVVKIGDSWPK